VEINYRGGEVQRSDRRVEVYLGQPVRLVVSSNVADEVHVHGYDKTADVPAGGTAVIEFPATIPGVFEGRSPAMSHAGREPLTASTRHRWM
jgi:hypothetical protein